MTSATGSPVGDVTGQRADALADRLAAVRRQVAQAAQRSNRSPAAVTTVAVSKGFAISDVLAARATGQADFGENRAQELSGKIAALNDGPAVRWHFIGRLQRNKVNLVVGASTLIHSVDSIELAQAIAQHASAAGRVQRILVQVNIGQDPAKGGCAAEDALGLVAAVRGLGGLACQGLSTMPPRVADPTSIFAALRELRDAARAQFPEVQHLSMGMTRDFEVAVEQGATIVRVGEGIFGPRPSADDHGSG